jgi:hypothetical protein
MEKRRVGGSKKVHGLSAVAGLLARLTMKDMAPGEQALLEGVSEGDRRSHVESAGQQSIPVKPMIIGKLASTWEQLMRASSANPSIITDPLQEVGALLQLPPSGPAFPAQPGSAVGDQHVEEGGARRLPRDDLDPREEEAFSAEASGESHASDVSEHLLRGSVPRTLKGGAQGGLLTDTVPDQGREQGASQQDAEEAKAVAGAAEGNKTGRGVDAIALGGLGSQRRASNGRGHGFLLGQARTESSGWGFHKVESGAEPPSENVDIVKPSSLAESAEQLPPGFHRCIHRERTNTGKERCVWGLRACNPATSNTVLLTRRATLRRHLEKYAHVYVAHHCSSPSS